MPKNLNKKQFGENLNKKSRLFYEDLYLFSFVLSKVQMFCHIIHCILFRTCNKIQKAYLIICQLEKYFLILIRIRSDVELIRKSGKNGFEAG